MKQLGLLNKSDRGNSQLFINETAGIVLSLSKPSDPNKARFISLLAGKPRSVSPLPISYRARDINMGFNSTNYATITQDSTVIHIRREDDLLHRKGAGPALEVEGFSDGLSVRSEKETQGGKDRRTQAFYGKRGIGLREQKEGLKVWQFVALYILAALLFHVLPQVPSGFVHIDHKARGEERPRP